MTSEQDEELKELASSLEVLDKLEGGVGNDQGADVRIQLGLLLMLATRLQRLNYQLDNLIGATSRISR